MSTPLPLSWYVDPKIFEIERRTVLADAAEYIGATAMVPAPGSYHTLGITDDAEVLVRDGEAVRLLSNLCLHRGMMLKQGRGRMKAVVCPLHAWSYSLQGKLLSATRYPETPCRNLPSRPLQTWNGLLFTGQRDVGRDLMGISNRRELDVSRYVYWESWHQEQAVNWKVPMEIFLEVYHVPYSHPGLLHHAANTKDLPEGDEAYGEDMRFLFDCARPSEGFADNAGSAAYELWQRTLIQINNGQPPKYVLQSLAYLPNIILEWVPHALFVTIYLPKSADRTVMHRDLYVDPQVLQLVPNYVDIMKAAAMETMAEDDVINERLYQSRVLGHRRDPHGSSGYEIYEDKEWAQSQFHEYLRKALAPYV